MKEIKFLGLSGFKIRTGPRACTLLKTTVGVNNAPVGQCSNSSSSNLQTAACTNCQVGTCRNG